MDPELRERWVHMMMGLRKIKPPFGFETEFPPGELMMLFKIAFMQFHAGKTWGNGPDTTVSDIRAELNISRPAVSQTLNSLEKKGLVTREIGRGDRRRIIVRLTPEGDKLLQGFRRKSDIMLDIVIERFGVERMREFLDQFDELLGIFQEVKEKVIRGDLSIETDI